MAIIKILPRDLLSGRATETLRQIARYDLNDLPGEFQSEREAHHAELIVIQREVEELGLTWSEIYTEIAYDVEVHESGRDENGW